MRATHSAIHFSIILVNHVSLFDKGVLRHSLEPCTIAIHAALLRSWQAYLCRHHDAWCELQLGRASALPIARVINSERFQGVAKHGIICIWRGVHQLDTSPGLALKVLRLARHSTTKRVVHAIFPFGPESLGPT